ncbi:hypothetical protein GIB67_020349 [Kingdonia uniflora]|uniref:Uncharacterized protein n=1 Tax=Kingdonia uniflora TaxID=39325 RepID=A0A7J7LRI7_9MAGN|nr:hypothetical protein GIB67_020349 [Kingdonia uniflora]
MACSNKMKQETNSQAYDFATIDGVVHLGNDDVSRMTNELTGSRFIFNPRDTLRSFREASPQANDQVPNEGAMHLGIHDVSRTIGGKTTSQFCTSLLSTLTISSQIDYYASNECAVQMGIDDVSRTNNVQSGYGFYTNLCSTFTIPRGTVQATYNALRTMNGQTFSGFYTNAQLSTLTSPRETSTQEDYHVSNGGPMHFGVGDISRTINRPTRTVFYTYSRNTLAIPKFYNCFLLALTK